MRRLILVILFVVLMSPILPGDVFAMMHGNGPMRPYGGYCRGPRWGWYGAQRAVNTVEDVQATLEEFLKGTDLLVGEIVEKPTFYEADIIDAENTVIDTLIVDKRTGRIRSKY